MLCAGWLRCALLERLAAACWSGCRCGRRWCWRGFFFPAAAALEESVLLLLPVSLGRLGLCIGLLLARAGAAAVVCKLLELLLLVLLSRGGAACCCGSEEEAELHLLLPFLETC